MSRPLCTRRLTEKEKRLYSRKKRRVSTEKGDALNVFAICLKRGFTWNYFHNRQKRGWPNHGGLRLEPVAKPAGVHCPGNIFLEKEADFATQAPEGTGYVDVEGRECPTTRLMLWWLGISRWLLRAWDDYCPLIQQGLNPSPAVDPSTAQRTKAYDPDLAAKAVRKNKEVKAGRFITLKEAESTSGDKIPSGSPCLSPLRSAWIVLKALKPKIAPPAQPKTWTRELRYIWYRLRKLIQAQKIKACQFGFSQRQWRALWPLESDIELLIEKIQKKRRRAKNHPGPFLKRAALGSLLTFNGVFLGETRCFTRARAAYEINRMLQALGAETRVTHVTLRKYCKRLPKDYRRIFPENKLPSRLSLVPGCHGMARRSITADDLQTLANAIVRMEEAIGDTVGRKTANQLLDDFGVHERWDRAAVARLLQNAPVSRIRARRSVTSRAMMFYDPCEVKRWLDGRDIIKLARESWDSHLINSTQGMAILSQLRADWTTIYDIRCALKGAKLPRRECRALWRRISLVLRAAERLGKVECDTPPSTAKSGPFRTKFRWRLSVQGKAAPPRTTEQPTVLKPPPKRRGRRPSSVHAEVVKRLCYEGYVAGEKLSSIRSRVARLYPDAAPKKARHVATLAQRYANKNGLPFPKRRARRSGPAPFSTN
jgi:hypothetical protein